MQSSSNIVAALIVGAPFLLPQQALADCQRFNGAVICSGEDENGFEDGTDSLSVLVQNGATVRDNGDAIKVEAAGLRVINRGTIISDNKDAIQSQSGLSVSNSGTIAAGDEGITADDPPRRPYSNAFVLNTGTISAKDDAIKIGARGTILNSGLIENIGIDSNDTQDAIDIDSGVIINQLGGVIQSRLDAAIDFDASEEPAFVSNSGTISGVVGIMTDAKNTAAQQVSNMGTIEGTSGISMDLGRGQDSVSLLIGGRFKGSVLLGQDSDSFSVGVGSFGDMANDFVVDGGNDPNVEDRLDFTALGELTAFEIASVTPDVFEVSVQSRSSDVTIRFTGFERFLIEEATLSVSEFMEFNP